MSSVRTTAVSRVMPHRMIQEGISPITSCTSSLRNSMSLFFSIIISFVCIFSRSFALMQKNQKIKASSASLLTSCTPLFASQTRALRSNSDAPGRSVPVVRFTLTSRGQSCLPRLRHWGAFLSPEDSSPVLRGAGSRSETEGLRCLPCHNISYVHLRRKILRLYNHPA